MRLGMSSHVVTTASATLKEKPFALAKISHRDLNLFVFGWQPLTMGDRRAERSRSRSDNRRQRHRRQMAAFKKNSGFKSVNYNIFDWIRECDNARDVRLFLVPLAREGTSQTNPVYAHKPGQGERKTILENLSDSSDRNGIMAIDRLEYATLNRKEFLCTRVKLKTGEEGWINVAAHDQSPHAREEWKLYCKVMRILLTANIQAVRAAPWRRG